MGLTNSRRVSSQTVRRSIPAALVLAALAAASPLLTGGPLPGAEEGYTFKPLKEKPIPVTV